MQFITQNQTATEKESKTELWFYQVNIIHVLWLILASLIHSMKPLDVHRKVSPSWLNALTSTMQMYTNNNGYA